MSENKTPQKKTGTPGGRLEGRVALITGASRGIGAAVAVMLANEGAHLILVSRTVGGLEETDDAIRAVGGTATLTPMDLRDFGQIDQLGAAIAERFGHLDILVGNAATLGVLSPVGHIQPKIWEEVVDVNLTANWRLIRSFDPLLRAAQAGRALFVTSGVTQGVFPYWGAYAMSKAALETLVRTYAGEISKTSVRANLIDPGVVRTLMRQKAFPGEDPLSLATPQEVAPAFLPPLLPEFSENGIIVRV